LPASPRTRRLSKRQLASKESLLAAGFEVLSEVGYTNLTLRAVASHAAITHTTAYTYFASKAHLVAELFYNFLCAVPLENPDPTVPVSKRIAATLGAAACRFGEVEALAQAGNAALLGDEPDVVELRAEIGLELIRRMEFVSGVDVDPEMIEMVLLTFIGSMLYAAFGGFRFDEIASRIETVARSIEGTRRA
jgi:AcrR family transcriptional regulator